MREIGALWVAMADVYGHRWTSAYGADPAKGAGSTWAKGLAGLAWPDMARGLDACMAGADPWPPTLPEFRAMCFGIPSLAAVRLDHSTPFGRLVWQYLDTHRMRHASADAADRMIRDAYELAREHVLRGGALPVESLAITHEEPAKPVVPETEAERLARLERIRQELAA